MFRSNLTYPSYVVDQEYINFKGECKLGMTHGRFPAHNLQVYIIVGNKHQAHKMKQRTTMYQHTFENATAADDTFNYFLAFQLMNFSATTGGFEKQTIATTTAPTANDGAAKIAAKSTSSEEGSFPLGGSSSSQLSSDSELQYLGANYEVNDNDVMCGRGRATLKHDGNKAFRKISSLFLRRFLACSKREQKQQCIAAIIDVIRSSGGHFLKFDYTANQWYDIGDKAAAAKVGHCLRDLKPSSTSGVGKIPARTKRAYGSTKNKNSKKKGAESEPKVLGRDSEEKSDPKVPGGDVFNGMFHPIDDDDDPQEC